jgi:hypothetical protein
MDHKKTWKKSLELRARLATIDWLAHCQCTSDFVFVTIVRRSRFETAQSGTVLKSTFAEGAVR